MAIENIENIETTSIDLTCSWPIEITAAATSDRVFDLVEDLRLLRGGPDCSTKLQPAFTDKMR